MDLLKFARHKGAFAASIMIPGFFKNSNEPKKTQQTAKELEARDDCRGCS
jgi:hypothetical protein